MGASVCCDHPPKAKMVAEDSSGEPGREDQELVNRSNEVDQKQFSESVVSLVKLAANGYPKALRSTYAKRNELLRKHRGDMDAAAMEVKGKGHSLGTEVKDMLLALIPYVGLPLTVLKPMWVELRRGCLIAAIYGHDLSKEETQARVMTTLGVAQGGEKAKEKSLELAIKLFWAALCRRLGLTYVQKLPVGKLVSVLDFADKAKQALVDEFKTGATQLPESVFSEVLDERPTHKDLADLIREKGSASLGQVKDQASSLLQKAKMKAGFS